MGREISDDIEKHEGSAVLKQGAPPGQHYLDGCHAVIIGKAGMFGDLRVRLGITAAKAGYRVDDQFEYTISIKKKE